MVKTDWDALGRIQPEIGIKLRRIEPLPMSDAHVFEQLSLPVCRDALKNNVRRVRPDRCGQGLSSLGVGSPNGQHCAPQGVFGLFYDVNLFLIVLGRFDKRSSFAREDCRKVIETGQSKRWFSLVSLRFGDTPGPVNNPLTGGAIRSIRAYEMRTIFQKLAGRATITVKVAGIYPPFIDRGERTKLPAAFDDRQP